MNLHIEKATEKDADFILHSNKMIDEASYIESSKLELNLKRDLFENEKTICLLAKDDETNIGMVLFSKVYWADRGRGVYVSQIFVEKEYRRQGIFKNLMKAAFDYYGDTEFVTCLVARKNDNMIACMSKCNFEAEDMLSYVVNKEDFHF